MRRTRIFSLVRALGRSSRRLLRTTRAAIAAATPKLPPAPAKPKRQAIPGLARRSPALAEKSLKDPSPLPVRKSRNEPGGTGLEVLTHVPARLRPGAPLVVLLHGCLQDATVFASATGWRDLADRLGFVLLMPVQTQANNAQRCFNWFRRADMLRDHGEAGAIHAMAVATRDLHRCNPDRVYVTGLSAGGAMTANLLAGYPDTFAAGAVVAGLPAAAANSLVGAMRRMGGHGGALSPDAWAARARVLGPIGYTGPWPRLSIWHGTHDKTVAPANAEHLAAQWTALHRLSGPGETQVLRPGATRTVWRDPGEPEPAIELWRIAGMGHGWPVAEGPTPDPFVLPAGLSAAVLIAEFWGGLGAGFPAKPRGGLRDSETLRK